jgi:hypothetical protein
MVYRVVAISQSASQAKPKEEVSKPASDEAKPAEKARPDVSGPVLLTILAGLSAAGVLLALAEMLKLVLVVAKKVGASP